METRAERLVRNFNAKRIGVRVSVETAQDYIEHGGQMDIPMFCDYLRINGLMYTQNEKVC